MPVMQLLLLIFMQDADKGILKITDWQPTGHFVGILNIMLKTICHTYKVNYASILKPTPRGIGETYPGAGDVAISTSLKLVGS